MEKFLNRISGISIFISESEGACLQAITEAQAFCDQNNLTPHIYVLSFGVQTVNEGSVNACFLHKSNINLFGKFKKNKRTPKICLTDEVFINLIGSNVKAINNVLKESKAIFKLGRRQLKGDPYNIVIKDTPEIIGSQLDVMNLAFDILKRIR